MTAFYFFLFFTLFYLIIAPAGAIFFFKRYNHRKPIKALIFPFFLLFGLFILIKLALAPYELVVKEQTIAANKLHQEIKVALISDFHLRPLKKAVFLEKIFQKTKNLQPDLIIFAGDFLFYDHVDNFTPDFQHFAKFSQLAPVYAVLGNHDYGISDQKYQHNFTDQHEKISALLNQAGVRILRDEKIKIKINNQDLWLVGFDEFWKAEKKPENAVLGLTDDLLKIGISHNPDASFLPEAKNLDIVLSGHTHSGQIRLPFLGPLGEANTKLAKNNYGQFLAESRPRIFNTAGAGESGLPIRSFNPPEIALLKIK